jgi:hypothetical protein
MAAESFNPQSLDFIFENTKNGTDSQMRDIEALDAKTIQIFAAGAIVIGLASFSGRDGGDTVTGLLIAALVTFAGALVASARSLWVREYLKTNHTDTLWQDFYNTPPVEIKHALAESAAVAYKHNRELIDSKAGWTQKALVLTGLEAFLVGAALVLTRLG